MAIIFYCHKCGQKGEFESKKDMQCHCGHYVDKQDRLGDTINMRNTWAKSTQIELSSTTVEQDIADRNRR